MRPMQEVREGLGSCEREKIERDIFNLVLRTYRVTVTEVWGPYKCLAVKGLGTRLVYIFWGVIS